MPDIDKVLERVYQTLESDKKFGDKELDELIKELVRITGADVDAVWDAVKACKKKSGYIEVFLNCIKLKLKYKPEPEGGGGGIEKEEI